MKKSVFFLLFFILPFSVLHLQENLSEGYLHNLKNNSPELFHSQKPDLPVTHTRMSSAVWDSSEFFKPLEVLRYGPASTSKDIYTYDSKGNQLKYIKQELKYGIWMNLSMDSCVHYENGAWVGQNKSIITYDINDNELTCLSQSWANGAWVNYSLTTNTYNEKNLHVQRMMQLWVQNSWQNYSRESNSYNMYGYKNYILSENWSKGAWVKTYEHNYTFGYYGNIISETRGIYSGLLLIPESNRKFTYNSFNQVTSYVKEVWINDAWIGEYKYTFSYDSYGNAVRFENFVADSSGKWISIYNYMNLWYNHNSAFIPSDKSYKVEVTYQKFNSTSGVEKKQFS